MIRRLVSPKSGLEVSAISAGVAALLTLYFAVFGSVQLEEIRNSLFSIAAGSSSSGWFAGPRVAGTYSWGGVPLYDALHGAGSRLPYKGAWYSSIEWPLRLVFNWKLYVYLKIFLATFAFLSLSLKTLQSWRPEYSRTKCLVVAMLFVSLAPRFLRWAEWPGEWSQTAAIGGLLLVFLHKDLFSSPKESSEGMFLDRGSSVLVAMCLAQLVSGHAGNLPNALMIVAPMGLALATNTNTRRRIGNSLRCDKLKLLLLSSPVIVSLVTIAWELQAESSGLGAWTRNTPTDTGGVFPDQAFVGFTRGLLPPIVERVASVLFSNMFEPLARLAVPFLPSFDVLTRTTGNAPKGGFMGLLAVGVAMVFLLRRQAADGGQFAAAQRGLLIVVVVTQCVALALSWAAQDGLFPPVLIPSGAYKTFIMLLPMNVLLSVVMLHRESGVLRGSRIILRVNLVLIVIYSLMQFDVISPSATVRMPARYDLALPAQQSESITGDARTAILGFESSDPQGLDGYAPLFGIPLNGKPVLQSGAEMRNTNNMRQHLPTDGGYGPIDMTNRTVGEVSALLDFFQVDHVLVRRNTEGEQFVAGANASVATTPTELRAQPRIELMGSSLLVSNRDRQFVDILVKGRLSSNEVCAVLDESCPVTTETWRGSASPEPKLAICNDPCLWRYQAGRIRQGETLVLPVSFDRTLRVQNSQSVMLPTTNIAGFLGVVGPIVSPSEVLTVTVSPDSRMFAIVTSSYLTPLSFVALIALLARKRRVLGEEVRQYKGVEAP